MIKEELNLKGLVLEMLLKINGKPLVEKEEGIELSFDLHDYFEVVHTPLLADIKYNGHAINQYL